MILGVSEAAESVSFAAMAERQQALAAIVLRDPAVESLSSFIGIDGVNTTANAGRIQINLKPLAERDASASEVIRRLEPKLAEVDGATLYMQPVQDITVDDRVSRTQFQYSLASPRPRGAAALHARAHRAPPGPPRAPRPRGRSADRWPRADARDRPRHRVTPRDHAADDRRHALRRVRAAPGVDHLHPAEPVPRRARGRPELPERPEGARPPLRAVDERSGRAAGVVHDGRAGHDGALRDAPGAVPGGDALVQPGAGCLAGRSRRCHRSGGRRGRPSGVHSRRLPGDGAGVPGVARESAVPDPRRASSPSTSCSGSSTRATSTR